MALPSHIKFAAVMLSACLVAGAQAQQSPPASSKPAEAAPAAEDLNIPKGEAMLGSVRIPAEVLADGQRLPAGTYTVRLTGEAAEPIAPGALHELERWVEFLQGDAVRGRTLAPLVPASALSEVTSRQPPARGQFRVERLSEDDYLRVWYNLGGDQLLIYLPLAPRAPAVENTGARRQTP